MPQYSYKCLSCEKTKNVFKPMSEFRSKETCECGKAMERDFFAEHNGFPHHPGNWPIHSEAMAVHPDQIKDAMARDAKCGIPTEYDKHGRPIWTSQRHKKLYCESYGYFDKNGGYGDPQKR